MTHRSLWWMTVPWLIAACGSTPSGKVSRPLKGPVAEVGNACPQGFESISPGCGGGDADEFTGGCYQPCQNDTSCSDGRSCVRVTIDPCSGEDCEACGQEASFCM